jgi:riboflavin kinase/FMN adenylyltransferase
MKVLQANRHNFKINEDGPFGLTIGNFDGVHQGHQDLLNRVRKATSKALQKMIVMTFVPHPIKIIRGASSFLLNTYIERRSLLERYGADYLVEIHFSRDFSTQSPENFLNEYILSIKDLQTLYLGYDFAFGSNKAGDHEFVTNYCKGKCEVEIQPEFKLDNENVSSSTIRKLLLDGDVLKANNILGREHFISGRVVKGAGRGRQIGVPTANIEFDSDLLVPKRGVYITRTQYKDQLYFSVTNIGKNPTFKSDESVSVETHLLDFDNDIYGDEISVQFIERIRDEKKFESVNELIAQIKDDVETSRKHFEI